MAKLNLRRLLAASMHRAFRTCFVPGRQRVVEDVEGEKELFVDPGRQRIEEDVDGDKELDKKYGELIARVYLERRCEQGVEEEEDAAEPSEPSVALAGEEEEEEDLDTFNKRREDAAAVIAERAKRVEANVRYYAQRRPKLGRIHFIVTAPS